MESEGSGAAGCSAGSIVWVRRRNGSWWPGKILGPEELAASHLTSPRSGTPVKLLGREDASVDWYNLEKSKRVKAFRCGEFDDCIEKAESSQGMPIKKREKYARREDAILHALELERQLLGKQGKLGLDSDRRNSKSSGDVKKLGIVASSEIFGEDNVKLGNSNSHQGSSRLEIYHKDKTVSGLLSSQKAKDGNQLSRANDHPESLPRMRDLQDFGLTIAPSKQRLPSSVASNGSRKPTADNHAEAPPDGGDLSMGNASHTNGVEQMGLTSRAKRSRCVYFTADHNDSLDYNEASPGKIEMSTSQFGMGNFVPHPGSLIEENSSGFMEDVESDSSETDTSESESDSSETEPDMNEEMILLSEAEWNAPGRSEAQEHGSMSTEEHDESAFSGDMSHLYLNDHVSANDAVSKWRHKGKRNIRNLTKRSVDASDGVGSTHRTYPEEKRVRLSRRTQRQTSGFRRNDDFDYSVDDDDINERDFETPRVRLDNRYSLTSKAASRSRNTLGSNFLDWEDFTWQEQPAMKRYWSVKTEPFGPYFDGQRHFGGRPRSMLVNVDLKVQASYQKEPVPIVSLMSKLNGKAIIGHPIQIESLEDGSAETLLSTVDFGNEVLSNENTALQPAWRTARRTANFRIPRPQLSSALDGEEATSDVPLVDPERKHPSKKVNAGSFSHKSSLERSNSAYIPRPPTDRKSAKKLPKKVSLSASQKTRTLSSLATEQNFSVKPIQDSNSSQMDDGLIKPDSSGPTTVACIPVKLVFSRLLEKINRPPSRAASNAVLLNSNVERNPS